MRLKHQDTGVVLACSDSKYNRPIAGQHEVCGSRKRDGNTWWIVTEGVFFPPREANGTLHDEF